MLPVEEEPVKKKVSRKWLIAILAFIFLFLLPFTIGYYASVNSWAYAHAVKVLQTSEAVIDEVGEPVEIGYIWWWKISDTRGKLRIPFLGSRGKGKAYIYAVKENGVWLVKEFHATIEETGKRINLK